MIKQHCATLYDLKKYGRPTKNVRVLERQDSRMSEHPSSDTPNGHKNSTARRSTKTRKCNNRLHAGKKLLVWTMSWPQLLRTPYQREVKGSKHWKVQRCSANFCVFWRYLTIYDPEKFFHFNRKVIHVDRAIPWTCVRCTFPVIIIFHSPVTCLWIMLLQLLEVVHFLLLHFLDYFMSQSSPVVTRNNKKIRIQVAKDSAAGKELKLQLRLAVCFEALQNTPMKIYSRAFKANHAKKCHYTYGTESQFNYSTFWKRRKNKLNLQSTEE